MLNADTNVIVAVGVDVEPVVQLQMLPSIILLDPLWSKELVIQTGGTWAK